ncbi:MAG: hypothetical protein CVU71_02290 [Deltaproteobacteria bacterium HGW-Deltaproteobacteria-6]|jgi:MSHA pilin protein MshC|nr:MAG: hypothetical protein CVU71_02290 [Deltaproteobacteria bacterium HGW-Deltaproteobacteria-6]
MEYDYFTYSLFTANTCIEEVMILPVLFIALIITTPTVLSCITLINSTQNFIKTACAMKMSIRLQKILKDKYGFTIIEIIAVLIIIGILSAIAVSRSVNYNAEVYTGADALKSHLRYAQTMAMNSNPTAPGVPVICGISCNGSRYWLFKGTNIADAIRLPEDDNFIDSDRRINLDMKKIKITSPFTIYFDNRGIPYSAFTDVTTKTPLTSVMEINIQPFNATSPSVAVKITPLTGYIP